MRRSLRAWATAAQPAVDAGAGGVAPQRRQQQQRFKRGRPTDSDVPFASVNKFEWGGGGGRVIKEAVGDGGGLLTRTDLRDIVEEVLPPQAEVSRLNEHEASRAFAPPTGDETIMPATSGLLKVAELGADRLAEASTHASLIEDFPELRHTPAAAQVLGRYREKTEDEKRVMDAVAVHSDRDAGEGAAAEGEAAASLGPSFSPETRRAQISDLVSQLTYSTLHSLPEDLEAMKAAELCALSPWEFCAEESPLPEEYWEMSHAERRFLGLPYKSDDGMWNPPLAHFTERAADDINLKVFKDIMQKVRQHGGSRSALVREEIEMLRKAEDSIFNHLRARLDDMTPFLDERSKVWRQRRGMSGA